MKKLFLLLLALIVALFVFVACSDESADGTESTAKKPTGDQQQQQTPPCTQHTDTDKDSKCDTCGKALPYTGLLLSDKVIAQLKDAKSFKLDVEVINTQTESEWYDADGEAIEETYSSEMISKFYFTVSYDDHGKIRVFGEQEGSYTDSYEDNEVVERAPFLYIIDGLVYTYDEDVDGYLWSPVPADIGMIEDSFASLTSGITVDEKTRNELLSTIGDFAITAFSVAENKGTISFDLKDELNGLIKCFADLDPETDTVEDLLNSIIDVTGSQVEARELVTEILDILSLTVKEAIEQLDAWCLESYGTNLQEAYDSIVTNPTFEAILKNAIRMSVENAPQQPDDIDATVEETYEQLFLSLSFEEIANNPDYAELTVFEILEGISGNSEGLSTAEDFREMVLGILSMTVADFEATFETLFLPMIGFITSGLTIDSFDFKADINFKGVLNIDSVWAQFNFGFTRQNESDVLGKTDTTTSQAQITAKIYEITNEQKEIAIDSEAEIYPAICNRQLSNGEDYMFVNCYDGDVYVELYFDYDGSRVTVISEILGKDILKSTTVTVSGEDLSIYSDEATIIYEPNGELKVEIDLVNGTYTVLSMPEFSKQDNIIDALSELVTGNDADNSDKYDLDPEFGGVINFFNGEIITLYLPDDYYINYIEADCILNIETGALECTIVSLGCESDSPLYKADFSGTWYGGIDDNISEYFGGEETFIIYLDENGIIRNDGIPDVLEMYRDNG